MSSQHWDEMPRRAASHRRTSSDYEHFAPDPRYSTDSQAPRRAARASIQTTVTDAPTETTFNPQSPGASSFTGHGLAPRPPSYQRGAGQEPPFDNSDRRPRGIYLDEDAHQIPGSLDAALPAAPDVPRAPPVSYRHPQPQPSSSRASGTGRYGPPVAESMDLDRMSPLVSPTRESHPWIGAKSPTRSPLIPRGPPPVDAAGQPRKQSVGGYSDRRKKLKDERSPLQRLELTLDSMTKEEKRARMQAAEQRARERAGRSASGDHTGQISGAGPYNGSAPRQGSSSSKAAPPAAAVSQRRPSAPATLAEEPPREPTAPTYPTSQTRQLPDDKTQFQPDATPKRNLSFRDRAADAANAPVTRRVSNKLHKEWPAPHQEDQTRDLHSQRDNGPELQQPQRDQPPASRIPLSSRNKKLPPLPPSGYHEDEVADATTNRDAHDISPVDRQYGIPQPAKRPNAVYGIEDTQVAPIIENKDVAAARRRLERQDSDFSSQSSHHHRVSNMLYKSPEHFRPGDGLYKPPQWLDEWKKGPVGFLAGGLLDVHEPPPSDTYKAWWEEGGRRKGSGGSTRRRRAEAFDGEYDDVDGGKWPNYTSLTTPSNISLSTDSFQTASVSQVWPSSEILWYSSRDFACQSTAQRTSP